MAAEGKAIDALSQFELVPVFGLVGRSVGFSQSTAHMLLAVGLISGLMVWGMARGTVVPGRLQALAETAYDFVHGIVRGQVGEAGMRYFPFVFSLFMFVLFGNLLGMLPFAFTFTSHIAVTFALAAVVFFASVMVPLLKIIALVYLATIVLGFFGVSIPLIHESGLVGIGFSLFVVVIAALNLVLDFDFIETGAEQGAPKYMEWYGAFGLMVTLVWLYIEFLRLLSKLQSRD